MIWVSFRYRPDSTGEFETSVVTPADQPCQTERHMTSDIPAAWLEILYTASNGDMVVNRAWFTCKGCHAGLEADFAAAINQE